MGIAENKQVVAEYFGCLGRGDHPAAIAKLADDITWWVPPASPLGGTYEGKDAVLGLFASGAGLYDPSVPLAPTIEGMVAEGDEVAVEIVISGRSAKGKDYRNHYHFLFTIRGGKIRAVKEYVDTLYAQKVLFE